MIYKTLKIKHMHWMSILGLILLFAGSFLSYFGGIISDERTKKSLSFEISSKNDKIDSLYKKIEYKDAEIDRLKQWNDIVSIRLLKQVRSRMSSLFNTILSNSNIQNVKVEDIDQELMHQLCLNCDINKKTKTKKYVSYNPLILESYTVRELLINNWHILTLKLNEINDATNYIDPQAYELALRIKNSDLALSIDLLEKPINNTTLEAWSDSFYEFLSLYNELNNTIALLDKENI